MHAQRAELLDALVFNVFPLIQTVIYSLMNMQGRFIGLVNYELLLSVNVAGQVQRVKAVVWWQAWSPTPYQLQSWTVVA